MTNTFTHKAAIERIAQQFDNAESAELKACAIVIAYAATHGVKQKDGSELAPVDVLHGALAGKRFDAISDMPKAAAAIRYDVLAEEVNSKGHKAAHACANRIAVTWRKAGQLMAGVAGYETKHMRDLDHKAGKALHGWCAALASGLDGLSLAQAETYVFDAMVKAGLDSINVIKRKHKAQGGTAQNQVQSSATPSTSDTEETAPIEPGTPAQTVSELDGLTIKIDQVVERAGAMSDVDKKTLFEHMAREANKALAAIAAQETEAETNAKVKANAA